MKEENDDYLSTYVRKINVTNSAFGIYCNKPLVYGNGGQKIYLSMLRNQQHTCLVRRIIYPPHSYHFIGGSLQAIHQVRLVPVLPWHVSVHCLLVQQKISTPLPHALCLKRTLRIPQLVFQILNIILKFISYLLLQKIHYAIKQSQNYLRFLSFCLEIQRPYLYSQ